MDLIYLYAAIFFCMLSLPVGIAFLYHVKKPAEPMYINQNKTRDPRFFANNFNKMIDNAVINCEKSKITINGKEEKFINSDTDSNFSNSVDRLVLAFDKDLLVPSNVTTLKKAVYAKKNIMICDSEVVCDTMYAQESIYLKKPVIVDGWVDAKEHLVATDGCDLGKSASSQHKITLTGRVEFRRLYAPSIHCGEGLEDCLFDFKSIVTKEDYISKSSITLKKNTKFIGDIRSYKDIVIEDNTIMKGNVFADGNITIGKNCLIYGTIFSQESIEIGEGSIIGQSGAIRSVIARGTVILNPNCIIYGYISCEKGGCKKG
ncbi:Polymer-forming protein [Granulicatella balaenopterae]|uniref:Polymer-forming protein n=1 Tax=Granulicatella balaenopterae TaxID=137733 RepID=A0A1H9KXA6_9LACT|nr:polymer-forming cytoskeletal protein [Granulicatella balaenopterae]SER03861.1 Polymer-forming protein [Granulicatella balaenopterae]